MVVTSGYGGMHLKARTIMSMRYVGNSAPVRGGRGDQRDDDVRSAVKFAAALAVAGFVFLMVAGLWVGTCGAAADIDTVACGRPQRMLLGLGAPLILLFGGVWAFYRTYQVWRRSGTWWAWQGAGWFLMTLMMLALTQGFPPLAGPAIAG
jgi:hypothetical protein